MYAAEVFIQLYRAINTPCDAKLLLKLYCIDYCTHTYIYPHIYIPTYTQKEYICLHCDFQFVFISVLIF